MRPNMVHSINRISHNRYKSGRGCSYEIFNRVLLLKFSTYHPYRVEHFYGS